MDTDLDFLLHLLQRQILKVVVFFIVIVGVLLHEWIKRNLAKRKRIQAGNISQNRSQGK